MSVYAKGLPCKTHVSLSSSHYRDLISEDDSDIESPALLYAECEDLVGSDEDETALSEFAGDHFSDDVLIDVVIDNLEALELPLNMNGTPPMNKVESGMEHAVPLRIDKDIDVKMRMSLSNSSGDSGTKRDFKSRSRPFPLFISCRQIYWRAIANDPKENTQDLAADAVGNEEKPGVSGTDCAAAGHNGAGFSDEYPGDARCSHDSCRMN
ncbi:hypothetical protein POM88_027934 [Heracleum sosnowskyi]|uniref:Uncharacterized protein n=1 Tax=Heracleum sosnowskyi TaxID=360622 RepID=A0AAD8IC02_9APIA|nr:hypothetical protein POM88_027934 [Heracleum sosnowskyi]